MNTSDENPLRRMQRQASDSFGEELEFELEDRKIDALAAALSGTAPVPDREPPAARGPAGRPRAGLRA